MSDRHQRKTRGGWLVALGVMSAGLLWCGCSVERDYEILSFFFDGVPDPAALEAVAARDAVSDGSTPASTLSVHTAYVERRCAECHGDSARFGLIATGFTEMTQSACAGCHAAVTGGRRLHGPVAAGECLPCHRPHYSSFPKLLVNDTRPLCLSCHVMDARSAPPGSPHADQTRDCLECHDPHGGADRYFLRPAAIGAGGAGDSG